ncbi:MAG: zf-HC2 domain-containing protein [candidate division KSB1 bacterium]|nr:zf-HC2 domain-containing protein [candidate division KSB1 bacterium]
MANCNFDRTKFIAYLFDELEIAEREELADHLQTCGECAAEVEQLSSVLDRWPTQQFEPPPLQLVWKAEQPKAVHQRLKKRKARRLVPAFGFAVAIAVIVFFLSWFLGENKKSNYWSIENSWEGPYRYHLESIDRTIETIKKDNFFN